MTIKFMWERGELLKSIEPKEWALHQKTNKMRYRKYVMNIDYKKPRLWHTSCGKEAVGIGIVNTPTMINILLLTHIMFINMLQRRKI